MSFRADATLSTSVIAILETDSVKALPMENAGMRYGIPVGLAVLSFTLTLSLPRAASADDHGYTGESKCEDCHDAKHEPLNIIGPKGTKTDPITVWQADPHHKASESLTSDWGKQAAANAKVSDPQAEGSMCLKCHATGVGGTNPPDPTEAVSCEACHGPGADWAPKDKHGEIGNDAAKMAAAVALGMLDVRKMDVRENNCRNCHVKDTGKRPCYKSSEKPFDVHNDKKFKHWRDNVPVI